MGTLVRDEMAGTTLHERRRWSRTRPEEERLDPEGSRRAGPPPALGRTSGSSAIPCCASEGAQVDRLSFDDAPPPRRGGSAAEWRPLMKRTRWAIGLAATQLGTLQPPSLVYRVEARQPGQTR